MKRSEIIETLKKDRDNLSAVILAADKRLAKAPDGWVRIVRHGKGYQFYLRKSGKDKSGTYMPVSEHKKAVQLMQKRYDELVRKAAGGQLKAIDRFLKEYDPQSLKSIYASLHEVRKVNIIPAEITDEEYVRRWQEEEYMHKAFSEDSIEHFTGRGERVRSKSEVMIADALARAEIPYRYECPLKLGSITVHPDFTVLRSSDREILYWEHFGMMDDREYCQKAIWKIRLYEKNGIYPGIRLIITMETSQLPINLTVIGSMIRTYCS